MLVVLIEQFLKIKVLLYILQVPQIFIYAFFSFAYFDIKQKAIISLAKIFTHYSAYQ